MALGMLLRGAFLLRNSLSEGFNDQPKYILCNVVYRISHLQTLKIDLDHDAFTSGVEKHQKRRDSLGAGAL